MKRFVLAIAAAAALMLPGCAALSDGQPPGEVAAETVLDEKAGIGVELAYEAFRKAAEFGVDAGLIEGERASKVAALDARAYQAVLVARAAYQAGNADTYVSAIASAQAAIAEGLVLMNGGAT